MAAETFDQRFKRLTGDMLMLDICRILGIEIRELMRIRQGVRVNISMDKLRKLCLDQGLDFASFTRDIASPWSSEITADQAVGAKTAAEPRMRADAASQAAKKLFREDGSRVVEPSSGRAPKLSIASNTATSERPRRLSELPIVSDRALADETSEHDGIHAGLSVVGRIKAAMANAAALLGTESPQQRNEDVAAESHKAQGPVDVFNYPEPDKAGWVGDQPAVSSLIGEVTELRREVKMLSSRIDQLIGR